MRSSSSAERPRRAWSSRWDTRPPTVRRSDAAVEAGARLEHAPGQRHRLDASPASEPDLGAGGTRRTVGVVHRRRPSPRPRHAARPGAGERARRGRSWSATPARWPGCHRAVTATGPSIRRARSWWRERPTWPARTRGSKSACDNLLEATGWTLGSGHRRPSRSTPRSSLGRPSAAAGGRRAGEPRPVSPSTAAGDLIAARRAGSVRERAAWLAEPHALTDL